MCRMYEEDGWGGEEGISRSLCLPVVVPWIMMANRVRGCPRGGGGGEARLSNRAARRSLAVLGLRQKLDYRRLRKEGGEQMETTGMNFSFNQI